MKLRGESLAAGLDCDYMTGEQPYKMRLATNSVPLYNVRATAEELAALEKRESCRLRHERESGLWVSLDFHSRKDRFLIRNRFGLIILSASESRKAGSTLVEGPRGCVSWRRQFQGVSPCILHISFPGDIGTKTKQIIGRIPCYGMAGDILRVLRLYLVPASRSRGVA